MNKNTKVVVITISIILILVYTLASTYSVIINVTNKEGIHEIVNKINIIDLLTNEDGTYNNIYYEVKNELNITESEATLLIESIPLNESLQIVLKSIVDYKMDNDISAKLTNDELYNLIVDSINQTNTISDELKDKVIKKSFQYKQDISNYIYDIEVSPLGEI